MAREPFAAKLTSIWIGGFIFWVFNGFSGSLTHQYDDKYQNRNVWTGYVFMLFAAIAIGYFLLRE